ncbi:CAP domain-containing protein [Thermoanaerobacterium sp. CMT5567-10]|uniref:CAP domain-containing protein n=1 Tax=Thermoanaerobacterium sp. CMT5567-10 TaxID=3061989 RepID=UPI0026E06B9D|nr:CAP domain-containing protein [Thermoanaerobacterium sp. CMT5567-10]WKV09462.1 CAP domain-containing protein [Thermoanaerobacterium sp. CMT5567-10]
MKKNLKYYVAFAAISLSVMTPFATVKASYSFGTYTKNNVIYNTVYDTTSSNVNAIKYSGFNTSPIKINYLNSTNIWYSNNFRWTRATIATSKINQAVVNGTSKSTATTSLNGTQIGNGQVSNIDKQNYQGLSAQEKQLVDLINKERTSRGLSPLTIDENLSKVAHIKAEDMKGNNYFSHTSPTYGSPFDMMKQFGISYNAAAENIAENSDIVSAHYALMNSSGHRDNILNPYFNKVGVGVVSNNNGNGVIVVEMFIKD